MSTTIHPRILGAAFAVVLTLGACGGEEQDPPPAAEQPVETTAPPTPGADGGPYCQRLPLRYC